GERADVEGALRSAGGAGGHPPPVHRDGIVGLRAAAARARADLPEVRLRRAVQGRRVRQHDLVERHAGPGTAVDPRAPLQVRHHGGRRRPRLDEVARRARGRHLQGRHARVREDRHAPPRQGEPRRHPSHPGLPPRRARIRVSRGAVIDWRRRPARDPGSRDHREEERRPAPRNRRRVRGAAMPDTVNSPAIAMRAGNRTEMMVARTSDPVYRAKVRWNDELVLNGEKPTGSEPPRDGVPYSVPGAPQPFCWPNVKVSSRAGFLPGPEVRFQQKDDGMHLTVVFEEDPARRIPNTVPFDVKVNGVKLIYGTDPADVLDFPQPLPEPLDPAKGPAFTIEADALVPTDERRARIVSALQTAGGARWVVTMAFQWLQTITPAAPPPTPPGGVHIVPGLFTMHVDGLAAAHTVAAAHTAAVGQASAAAIG